MKLTSVFLLCAFCLTQPLLAQKEHADSLKAIYNDTTFHMPNGVTTNAVFQEKGQCGLSFVGSDSTGARTFYRDLCITKDNTLGRIRIIDVRWHAILFLSERDMVGSDSSHVYHCHVWFDEGFYHKTKPNGKLLSFNERRCNEHSDLLMDLLISGNYIQ